MLSELSKKWIKVHEGYRSEVYYDIKSNKTIGFVHFIIQGENFQLLMMLLEKNYLKII